MEKCSPQEKLLLDKYAPLVRRVAYALQSMRPAMLEQDDVMQDGMVGLLRAIRSNRGTPSDAQFAAFANINIRGAIIDGYRSVGELTRGDYSQAKKIRQAVREGQAVDPLSLSFRPEQLRASADELFASAWLPGVNIDGVTDDAFQLADPEPGPEQRAIANQLLRRAIDALQAEKVRDRTIFIFCELQGERHAEVAKRFQLTSGRVSQILKQVRQRVLLAIA